MDQQLSRSLYDQKYERRKSAALELEKLIRDYLIKNDFDKISQIIDQLCKSFSTVNTSSNVRNGGLIGLAAAAIALGDKVSTYLNIIVQPILNCFSDNDSRIRYFACESMYNIAKVSRSEMLVYFRQIFDALNRLSADSEVSVKNGAELLDRLMKDIVSESGTNFIYHVDYDNSVNKDSVQKDEEDTQSLLSFHSSNYNENKIFSLSRFIPLLAERIYVVSPFTRIFLISWVTVFDSISDYQILYYLPQFLDGLIRYLSDPSPDVRSATQSLLSKFLFKIQHATMFDPFQKNYHEYVEAENLSIDSMKENVRDYKKIDINDDSPYLIDHLAIAETLFGHLTSQDEEIQLTSMRWILELIICAPAVLVPLTPRLIPAILPQLAHQIPAIQDIAKEINKKLYNVVRHLPEVIEGHNNSRKPYSNDISIENDRKFNNNFRINSAPTIPTRNNERDEENEESLSQNYSGSFIDNNLLNYSSKPFNPIPKLRRRDSFDYQLTLSNLTLQLLDDNIETRVAALDWMIMIQTRTPGKVFTLEDGTFPALLKTLSDSSDEVIKRDLRLLAQISRASGPTYFAAFMANLLELFSTDRRLLENRGSLIIRQLCLSLGSSKIYDALAGIIEDDEDLEFASLLIQKLTVVLVTSPELSDLRNRLKKLENVDDQSLFCKLYRCWSHNAISVFTLCLLSQAYEHASDLLYTISELEVTVNLLVQIDKLVQLIESPVFSGLRLQLLEPDRNPYLFKCLYGILMLLPQSSAFLTLKNRLDAIGPSGRQINSKSQSVNNDINKSKIPWDELHSYFRATQNKHEQVQKMHRVESNTIDVGLDEVSSISRTTNVEQFEEDYNDYNLTSPRNQINHSQLKKLSNSHRKSDTSVMTLSTSPSISSLATRFGITPMMNKKLLNKSSKDNTSGTVTPTATTSAPSVAMTTFESANANIGKQTNETSSILGSSRNSLRRFSGASQGSGSSRFRL